MLAGELAGRQRQEQRREPDRTDRSAMKLRGWLAVVFALLALAGCIQATGGSGQASYATSSPNNNGEYPRDRGGDGGDGGGGGGM
jgi:hypothetical protein